EAVPQGVQGPQGPERVMTHIIAVVGAGTMGHGIAQVAATAGVGVRLFDVSEEQLAQARADIEANLEKAVAKGKLDADAKEAALGRLSTHHRLEEAVAEAALVIEAAPERMEIKRDIFARLSQLCGPNVVLATNTSSMSVTE